MGMLMHRHQELNHTDDENITKLRDVQPFPNDSVMLGDAPASNEARVEGTDIEQEAEPKRRGRPRATV